MKLTKTAKCGKCFPPDINYYLKIATVESVCYATTVNLDTHFPFSNSFCSISSGQPASVCTLRVCAGEELCLRMTYYANSSQLMCGPGSVNIPSAAASSVINSTSTPYGNGFQSSYCFTSSTTPGIYQVSLCWTYVTVPCGDQPPPGSSTSCCGSFYLEVGPPAPLNLGYTINPNPVCKGQQTCFNANQPNIPGYTYYFESGINNPADNFSPTGSFCMSYTAAGTFNTALTVYNGYCPSPRVTQPIVVQNPSVSGQIDHNGSCRNYTFTANPSCLPAGATYTWNIAGTTYTGSPLTIDIPGNSASVPVSLTATAPGLSPAVVWNTTITNVPVLTASISPPVIDGCGIANLTATPTVCVPTDAIYTWHQNNGINHIGNPIKVAIPTGATTMSFTLTVTSVTGTVLYTTTYNVTGIAPQSQTCCVTNTECVITNSSGRTDATCTQVIVSSDLILTDNNPSPNPYSNIAYTVMPNKKIIIAAGANITFSNCTFLMYEGSGFILDRSSKSVTFTYSYLHGCKKLWEGVKFANTGTSGATRPIVTFDHSMMEDAYIGFNFSNSPDYVDLIVSNSVFNKNITAIKYINKPGAGTTGAENKIAVTKTAFACKVFSTSVNPQFYLGQATYTNYLANANDAHPLTKAGIPYHDKSLIGISLRGPFVGMSASLADSLYSPLSTYINVSQDLIYDNLVQGVAIKGLNIKQFTGNKFIKMTSPLAGGNYPSYYDTIATGIYYSGQGYYNATGTFLPYQTIKVGDVVPANSTRNTFNKCYYGVFAKDEAIDVTYNYFNDCYNAVYLGHANVPSSSNGSVNATIKENQVVRLKYTAFTLNKNLSINASIDGNIVNNTSGLNFTSRAVDIIEATAPVSAQYSVINNKGYKVWYGARAVNTYKPVFTNNQIDLNTSTTISGVTVGNALYNAGISLTNCESAQVNENNITNANNTNTWWESGISTVNGRTGSFYCNKVNGAFSSITTGDHCEGTLIYKNDFHNAKFAHWLIFTNKLGHQYNPNGSSTAFYPTPPSSVQPADNRYYAISPYHSYAQNSTTAGIDARFFVRGNAAAIAPYAMPNNFAETLSTPITFPAITNSVSPYNQSGCNGNNNPTTGRLMSFAKEIAQDNLLPVNDTRNRFVTRKQLLSNLQKEAINNTGDADIDNFQAAMSNESVGKLQTVEELTQEGIKTNNASKFDEAGNVNDDVVPADSVEALQKQVNEAYLFYVKKGGILDNDIILLLQPIAALCPYRYGASIWQARALLVGFDNTDYFNSCEFYSAPDDVLSNARMANIIEDIKDESINSVSVYPNPNAGSFKIELPALNEEVTIDIVNTMGSIVRQLKHSISEKGNIVEIQDLTQGLYFVVVKQSGITIGTNRVIVTK